MVITNSAGSAKLEDTSLGKLTTELISWNLPDSQLHLESKRELSVAKHRTTWGDTTQIKHKLGGGDTTHTFFIGETMGWGKKYCCRGGRGTPHSLC